ncbi:helix-turn-helix domain-containing protein [Pseudogracilibacillus sp. SO30301A]|uniref:helix-turn-helix domain-containing protein n=1 Tax=Pseudogracilibacillus sp. SO30301A TaxID=3098291 RepID=UPI003FA70461
MLRMHGKLTECLNFKFNVPLYTTSIPFISKGVVIISSERIVLDRRKAPFVMVTRAILEDESLKAADKSVYSTLCMYPDNRTSDCFPSRETILKKSGVSDRTLRNCLKTLEERGYIEVLNRLSRIPEVNSNDSIIIFYTRNYLNAHF